MKENELNGRSKNKLAQLKAVREHLLGFQTDCVNLKNSILSDEDLDQLKRNVDQFILRLDSLEQMGRHKDVEIKNCQERDEENLKNMLKNMGQVVGIEIKDADILEVSRLQTANRVSVRPRSIIAKFADPMIRAQLIERAKCCRNLTSSRIGMGFDNRRIFVSEYLTVQNKKLLRKVRRKANDLAYDYVWIREGLILARKDELSDIIVIQNEQDLEKLH